MRWQQRGCGTGTGGNCECYSPSGTVYPKLLPFHKSGGTSELHPPKTHWTVHPARRLKPLPGSICLYIP